MYFDPDMPLHASFEGDVSAVLRDILARDDSRRLGEAFQTAARGGQLDVLAEFIHDGRIKKPQFHRDIWGAIGAAAQFGNVAALSVLLGIKEFGGLDMSGAVRRAIVNKHVEALKILLRDKRLYRGEDDIVTAIELNQPEILHMLLGGDGVEDEDLEHSYNILVNAVRAGNPDLLAVLLNDPRIDPSQHGNLALHTAITSATGPTRLAMVGLFLKHARLVAKDSTLLSAVVERDAELVRMLLQDGRFDPSSADYYAFLSAAQDNWVGVLPAFLDDPRIAREPGHKGINAAIEEVAGCFRVDDALDQLLAVPGLTIDPKNRAIPQAVRVRAYDRVERLMRDGRFDPADALAIAVQNGDARGVRLLIQDGRSDPSANHNQLLVLAASKGWADVVGELLADPRIWVGLNNNEALLTAARNGHADVVRRLLDDFRCDPDSLDSAIVAASTTEVLDVFLQHPRITTEPQHRALNAAIVEFAAARQIDGLKRILALPGLTIAADNDVIRRQIAADDAEIVKILLEDGRFDPDAGGYASIAEAIATRKYKIAEMLITSGRANPTLNDNAAIRAASSSRHITMLMNDPRVDPSANNNEAFRNAAIDEERLRMGVLMRDPRVRDVDHKAIRDFAIEGNHTWVMLVLSSWREPDLRAVAAAVAREVATDARLLAYLEPAALEANRRIFDCMAAFLPLNLTADVTFALGLEASRSGLTSAQLEKLHAQGRLAPMVDRVFGEHLATRFHGTFATGYRILANVAMGGKSHAEIRSTSTGQVLDTRTATQLIARSVVPGASQAAADLLLTIARESGTANEKPKARFLTELAKRFVRIAKGPNREHQISL